MLLEFVILIISLAVILAGAEVFTNGVEWLGKILKLGEGAVGSLLAAVGTAMPETLVPIVAILGGGDAASEIGIGAILGAPFMLSTLAMLLVAITVLIKKTHNRPNYPELNITTSILRRDLEFFLIVYTVAVLASFLPNHMLKVVASFFLIAAYGYYAWQTIKRDSGAAIEEDEELHPLYLTRIFGGKKAEPETAAAGEEGNHGHSEPSALLVILQIALALGLIISGAHLFVGAITEISFALGVPALILSLIIAPIATELPEKFNSVIWSSRGKDTLALGNITGAMVFQSSVVPTVGILLTPWILNTTALTSVVLAIGSAGMIYTQIRLRNHLTPFILLIGGCFYLVFLTLVFTGFLTEGAH